MGSTFENVSYEHNFVIKTRMRDLEGNTKSHTSKTATTSFPQHKSLFWGLRRSQTVLLRYSTIDFRTRIHTTVYAVPIPFISNKYVHVLIKCLETLDLCLKGYVGPLMCRRLRSSLI